MERQLRTILQPIDFNMKRWHISFDKKAFSQYNNALTRRLRDVIKSMGLPVLNLSGHTMDHFVVNLSTYIVKTLLDDDYRSLMNDNVYTILDLPHDSVFYTHPKIEISSTSIDTFNQKIYSVTISENNVEVLLPDNPNKVYHKVFDNNLQTQLLNNLQNLTDQKLAEIIGLVYDAFVKKVDDEHNTLRNNSV
jgi:hypothetical protein